MRVGIHIESSEPQAKAIAAGFTALGWRHAWRSGLHHKEGQTEKFDVIVVDGLRGNRRALVADYAAVGVPAIVIDFGYLRRADENSSEGYWSVGLGKLGWVPEFDCPADRWNGLGLALAPPSTGDVTIIAGQMIGDANCPFATADAMARWAESNDDGHAAFRPHPRSPDVQPESMPIDRLPLAESLAHAQTVIAWSSNIGHDALLAGVPAIAAGDAPWKGVTLDTREPYFRRLAYAQWTLAELSSGEALKFVLDPKPPVEQSAERDIHSLLAAHEARELTPKRRKLSLNKVKA